MRCKVGGSRDAFGNLGFVITRAVFATLGVVADEALEGGADLSQLFREIEQFEKGLVPRHQAQVGIKNGEPLIEQVEPRLQHFVALGGVGRRGIEEHVNNFRALG